MKAPWANKTGAAKIAVWSATVLGVSLGLCGANYAVFAHLVGFDNASSRGGFTQALGFLVIVTGLLESIGIVVGAVGVICALLFGLWDLAAYLVKERDSE
jgi:hypothetical protein